MVRLLMMYVCIALLSGCVQKPSEMRYEEGEVGKSFAVEFGTVASVREVQIYKKNRQAGTMLGAGTGFGGGSYVGDGTGNVWAEAGGAIAGAVVGGMIEDELSGAVGHEYMLHMRDGTIKTIVQEVSDENPLLVSGDKVMLRYCDAGNVHVRRCAAGSEFQRLTKVDSFPPELEQKKKRRKSN